MVTGIQSQGSEAQPSLVGSKLRHLMRTYLWMGCSSTKPKFDSVESSSFAVNSNLSCDGTGRREEGEREKQVML